MDLARGQDADKIALVADVIRRFGQASFAVTGTSMLPALWPDDVVTVSQRTAAELQPGQVVLCYRNQAFTMHRLIDRRADCLITRGDSLSYEDPPFRDAEVLGEVSQVLRNGRLAPSRSSFWLRVGCYLSRHSQLSTRILLRVCRSSRMSGAN